MKLRYVYVIIAMVVSGVSSIAQDPPLEYADKVYVDYIRSVRFHVTGLLTSLPIMRLGASEALFLSFDDLDADSKYYYYTVIHCDREWNPSGLDFTEYVDGFQGEEIDAFDRSINTLVPFTFYSQTLPNDDFEITKTGNYLLVVYLYDQEYPVITRRFMVTDSKINVSANMVRPADVSKLRTHQELDFELSVEFLRLRDPKNDIHGVVLQNGRWDNAITGIRSKYERSNSLVFDYQNKIVFPSGMDFRNLDIRSAQYRSRDVFEILRENGRTRIVAEIDEPRANTSFLNDVDITGKYVIRSADDQRFSVITTLDENELGQLVEERSTVNLTRHNLEADYVDVLFTLKSDREYDSDVYLFGAFTDWSLEEKYRMSYNQNYRSYFADVQLKQGFYNYIFVLANKDGSPDEETIEGDWYEASNDYTILIYHTPFGARYDELVAAMTIPSSR
jgi:hypothetical protein